MILGQIDPFLPNLDKLNLEFPWIPNSLAIRPSSQDIERKKMLSKQIENEWISYRDYILCSVFGDNVCTDNLKKKYSYTNNIVLENNFYHLPLIEWVFQPSEFRYNLIPESNHWILWNSTRDFSFDFVPIEINQIIMKYIRTMGFNNFDFAWYKNPKPTIPEFYHVQVFWIELK